MSDRRAPLKSVDEPASMMQTNEAQNRGTLYALGSAILFGASPPFAKLLVPSAGPLLVATLLYLGAGIALSGARLVPGLRRMEEAQLRTADLPLIGAIMLFGGILGPVLMLWGLSRISGVLGSLLLNLEAPFTAMLGVLFFGDYLGSRGWLATGLVIAGAAVLSGVPNGLNSDVLGTLAIVGACISWALDNNVTQRLSLRDPVAVARAKALGAGACMLALVGIRGDPLPTVWLVAQTLCLGFASYGLSLVLAVHAMRLLGAARQAAFFASAPFVGALLSIPVLGERPSSEVAAAGALIVAGLFLLLSERHAHWHEHKEMDHDHVHVRDDHHDHAHDRAMSPMEPHSHPHHHPPLAHAHPHTPDVHHRHRH
jgi:drug/metabolite transporter (DMT)-like permease